MSAFRLKADVNYWGGGGGSSASTRCTAVTNEIRTAAVELDSTLLEYLTREIEYFNYQYETLGASENCDEALEDAGTVKESLEYFLGATSERVKGLLRILNEIFKLVSGGSGV